MIKRKAELYRHVPYCDTLDWHRPISRSALPTANSPPLRLLCPESARKRPKAPESARRAWVLRDLRRDLCRDPFLRESFLFFVRFFGIFDTKTGKKWKIWIIWQIWKIWKIWKIFIYKELDGLLYQPRIEAHNSVLVHVYASCHIMWYSNSAFYSFLFCLSLFFFVFLLLYHFTNDQISRMQIILYPI